MAKSTKDGAEMLMNPRLPRIVGSVTRSIEYSSPVPGRPEVLWVEGINPDIVRELWPSQGELPDETEDLREGAERQFALLSQILGVTRKVVVYERTHPEVRLVLLLDAPPYDREGEAWQSIVQSNVERDRGVDSKQSRRLEERLWDEICRVERRGRPRGTGHPKSPTLQQLGLSAERIARLQSEGLKDRDLRILLRRWENKTFKQIGRELGISTQAVWKRWKREIEPAIKRVNPRFSSRSFQLGSLDSN
jgi:hypothetical protein